MGLGEGAEIGGVTLVDQSWDDEGGRRCKI